MSNWILAMRSCGSGIIGLGRKFRIMDDDGSKSLNRAEFNKAMKECNLSLSDGVSQDYRAFVSKGVMLTVLLC